MASEFLERLVQRIDRIDQKSLQTYVLDLIKELNTQGHTVILVTHELEAARVAQRIVTLRDGLIADDQMVGLSGEEELPYGKPKGYQI